MTSSSVFISENHYLPSIAFGFQYDTIYHEHLRYYHLSSLTNLFERHGMEIFDAELIPTHGGSIRVYSSLQGVNKKTARLRSLLDKEKELHLDDSLWHADFASKIVHTKFELIKQLIRIREKGNKIYGIGAPSRATTLITYCHLDHEILDGVLEIKGSAKLNHYIPGTTIPVLDETLLLVEQPEYVLMLSWHIADELIPKLKAKGFKGKFIIPLPTVKIIE